MKKYIKTLVLIIISLLILSSCTTGGNNNKENNNDSYTITYYLNGNVIELSPNKYVKGEVTNLPGVPLTGLETFSGWYDNSEYKGNPINKITSTDDGNKIFYGKTEKVELETPSLKEALQKENYTYVYAETYNGSTLVEEYKYDNGKYANTYEDYYGNRITDYLYFENNEGRFVYQDGNTWYYTKEGDLNYETYATYMTTAKISSLNEEHFIYENDEFKLKEEFLQIDLTNFMGIYEDETYTSCKITLKNNLVDKIVITSDYNIGGEIIESTYEFSYSTYGTTVVSIPSAVYDNEGVVDSTISDIYSKNIGDTVTVTGVITGIYGNNFYLQDGTKGVLIYLGNDSTYTSIIEVGTSYTVTGSIGTYKDVYQIGSITSVIISNKEFNVVSKNLINISQTSLEEELATLVKVENATIKKLPTTLSSSTDTSFEIELNGQTCNVFISRHVESIIKNSMINVLSSLKIGDVITLNNVHVAKHTSYQLTLTSAASISKFTGEVKETGIMVDKTSLSVEEGTTFSEILGMNNLYITYNNNTKQILEADLYTISSNFEENKIGNYIVTYTYKTYSIVVDVEVYTKGSNYFKPTIDSAPLYSVLDSMGYDAETGITYGVTKGLPSTGEPKVLVIPVEFTDAPAPITIVQDLETAFFGTSTETGWESLQSYYYKSSYGKLNITGTVLEPFNTKKASSEYTDDYFDYEILKAALEYYDTQVDYSDYDTDKDGYIDSIYLVYTKEYDNTGDSNWWAYTDEYATETNEYYDNVEADFYVFMSYHFLFDELQGSKVKYNAETIIHETGHLLGLDDYYDYDTTVGPNGGIGGGDMMDYNVGDHNAYSKLMLGWITPIILKNSTITLDLASFEKTGDCVMVCKNWNGSFFTEYYIIDFFTPTGLNEIGKGKNGLFSISGIRIYHIDATLNNPKDCFSVWDVTKYNNSYSDHRLIRLVEADKGNNIDDMWWSEDSDLFQAGDVFNFAYWYENINSSFSVKVNSITDASANITITF